MDIIEVTGLKIDCVIGVYEWEKKIKQPLLIDLKIKTSLVGCNDEIKNTIDYDALCQEITNFVSKSNFNLIETIAEKVADIIKGKLGVEQLSVRISKPNAVKNAKNISVTIER